MAVLIMKAPNKLVKTQNKMFVLFILLLVRIDATKLNRFTDSACPVFRQFNGPFATINAFVYKLRHKKGFRHDVD